jgi:hypothetical protein
MIADLWPFMVNQGDGRLREFLTRHPLFEYTGKWDDVTLPTDMAYVLSPFCNAYYANHFEGISDEPTMEFQPDYTRDNNLPNLRLKAVQLKSVLAGEQYTIDYRIGAHRLKTMRPDAFEVPEIDANTEAILRVDSGDEVEKATAAGDTSGPITADDEEDKVVNRL